MYIPDGKPLSLQGPFQPSVVGKMRKHSGEDKRKRDGSANSAHSQFLPSVQSMEDLSPKRNLTKETHKEKTKCKVDFSSKVDTKFHKETGLGQDKKHVVQFTAKGKAPVKG